MAKPATQVVEVFLFGHYDSRGWTTAVVARTKAEAVRKYLGSGWFEELTQRERRQGVKEDYLGGPFLLESEGELPEGELDASFGGPGWVLINNNAVRRPGRNTPPETRDWEQRPSWKRLRRLRYVSAADYPRDPETEKWLNPLPDGWAHPRWDDDAYAFILLR